MRQLKISTTLTNRDSASVEKYFNEVSREPVLTPEEEVQLARRIREGDSQALERMVKANLRFVISVAKQYQHGKMPLNDLINEGNIGLIKAAKMFDETRGFKFISYAVWWIRQCIMQALAEHSRLVRIPYNKTQELYRMNQAKAEIEQRFEREATPEELADFMGVKPDAIRNMESANIRQNSLDAPFQEGEGNCLLDIMENKDASFADEVPLRCSLASDISRLMHLLSEKERDVIARFFGIGYEYNQSLEDIALDLGLTKERVRQIKEGSLKKLRSRAGKKLLQEYM